MAAAALRESAPWVARPANSSQDDHEVPHSSSHSPKLQAALSGWRAEEVASSSGCDSSDCTYCQARSRQAAALRQHSGGSLGDSQPACWLRRKRSRTDLPGLASTSNSSSSTAYSAQTGFLQSGSSREGDSVVPEARHPLAGAWASPGSMWDHALLEAPAAQQALGQDGTSWGEARAAASGWQQTALGQWDADFWRSSERVPMAMHEVASFSPPAGQARRQAADIVCAVEFEEHGWLVATAGVAKQIRVYSLASRLQHPDSEEFAAPIQVHRMPSKLSSLAWDPDQPGVVTVGDYDGCLSQIDLESGHLVAEVDGHSGRRVWSVSHSLQRANLCASASDDGAARLWAGPGLAHAVGVLRPARGAAVCGVQLSPYNEHLAALACADGCAYVYDLRAAAAPLSTLYGHEQPVSYVRWLGAWQLATASTDASLALWDLQQQCVQPVAGGAAARPWRTLRGHRNSKNFVGLSVRPEDRLVACGSESPACYSYCSSWDDPVAVADLETNTQTTPAGAAPEADCLPASAAAGAGDANGEFCGAVCWQPAHACPGALPLLAAASSSGMLRVLALQQLARPVLGPA